MNYEYINERGFAMFGSIYWTIGLVVVFLILFFVGGKKNKSPLFFYLYFCLLLIERVFTSKDHFDTQMHTVLRILYIAILLAFIVYITRNFVKDRKERKAKNHNE